MVFTHMPQHILDLARRVALHGLVTDSIQADIISKEAFCVRLFRLYYRLLGGFIDLFRWHESICVREE